MVDDEPLPDLAPVLEVGHDQPADGGDPTAVEQLAGSPTRCSGARASSGAELGTRYAPALELLMWRYLLAAPPLVGLCLLLGLRQQGATRASTWLYLSPPITSGWAWLMFGDRVGLAGAVGLVVTGVGVALVLRGSRPAQRPVVPSMSSRRMSA